MPARLFDVRRGEGPRVVRVGGAMFAILAGFTISETARDSLFLGTNGANRLAIAYLLLAGLALVALVANSALVKKLGRKRGLIVTLFVAAVGTAAFSTTPRSAGAGLALYMWTGLLGTVVVVQFWLLASTRFTSSEAKRLYGPIAAIGAFGTLSGSVLAWALLHVVAVETLLLVASGFYVVAALALARDGAVDPRLLGAEKPRPNLTPMRWNSAGPYVTRLATLTVCATATALLADWLLKSAAARTFDTEQLASFIARFNGSVAALSLAFQLFGATWLARRIGVLGMTVILPTLMMFGGASAMATAGSLFAVCITKGSDASLRYSVNRVATELLWMPVPEHVRTSVREPLESVVTRLVQAVTAALLLGLALLGLARPAIVALLVVVTTAVWSYTAFRLRNWYLGALRHSFSRRSLAPQSELDAEAVSRVVDALSSEDDNRVVAAIHILSARKKAQLIPALILRHDSLSVLAAALEAMHASKRTDWVAPARRLLKARDPKIRMLALRALARIDDDTAIIDGLCDDDAGVMAHGVFWSLQSAPRSSALDNVALQALLSETGARGETAARELLEAIRTDGDDRWAGVLLDLTITRGDDESLVETLALAIEHVPDPRLIPYLIARLGVRAGRQTIRRALVAIGDPALDALEHAIDGAPPRVQLHIPTTLALFANQRAATILAGELSKRRSGATRYRVLRALARMATRDEIIVDEHLLLAELRHHLDEHARLLALSIPLRETAAASEPARLVLGLLGDKIAQALQRAFLAMQALHPREQLLDVARVVANGDGRARAHANEFLDTLTRSPLYAGGIREQLLVLSEELDDREKLARTGVAASIPPDAAAAVAELVRDEDSLLAACAAYYASEFASDELGKLVARVADERALFEPLGMYHVSRRAG